MKNDIKIMACNEKFSSKPTSKEIGRIQNKLVEEVFSVDDLAYYLTTGGCFRPALLKDGRKSENWFCQQIFALDFDKNVKLIDAYAKAVELDIIPAFCYHTYTSSPEQEKFRFVFVNNEEIYDAGKRDKLQALLMGVWGDVDRRCFNRDRIFFGTYSKEVIHENFDVIINADEIISKYWDDSFYDYFPVSSLYKKNAKRRRRGNVIEDTVEKIIRETKVNEVLYYEPEDIIPYACYPAKCAAKGIIKCLDKYFNNTMWIEGMHREIFLFIMYNAYKILDGGKTAYEKVVQYNSLMIEPIENYYINSLIMHSDNHLEHTNYHGDGVFTYSFEGVIEALEIPYDIAEECGFFDSVKEKNRRLVNQINKHERDRIIVEKINEGYNAKEIADFLLTYKNGIYRCSSKTVMRVKQKSFSTDEVDKNDLTTFSSNKFFSTLDNDLFISDEYKEIYNKYVKLEKEADDNEQDNIINQLLNDYNSDFLITGKAGTGKTYLIEQYLERLPEDERNRTVIVAPTGVASCNFEKAYTIHNFFELGTKVIDVRLFNGEICKKILEKDIKRIIIDEVSMVRKDIFDMLSILIDNTANYVLGIKIQKIMLGDWTQLPPVVKAEDKVILDELYPDSIGEYRCYASNKWNEEEIISCGLFKSRRLEMNEFNSQFEEQLKILQFGGISSVDWFNANLNHDENEDSVYICPTNDLVDEFNKLYVESFDNISTFERIPYDDDIPYYAPSANNNTPVKCELSVGMKVMTIVNKGNFKNGNIGTVTKIDGRKITVNLDNTNKTVIVNDVIFCNDEGEYFWQLPLRPAKAITVHKSQGLTFDEINIVPGFFTSAQLYVALSRCKNANKVHLLNDIEYSEVLCDMNSIEMFIK